jgi:G patch domain/KOW motif-containing protein
MEAYGGGLSFALPAARKRPVARAGTLLGADRVSDPSNPTASLVSTFAADEQPLRARAAVRVIQPIANANLLLPGARQGVDNASVESEPPSAELDENAAAAAALLADVHNGLLPSSVYGGAGGADGGASSRAATERTARPAGSEDINYDKVPVDDFGKAMLRGMGWDDGKGVGRNLLNPNQPVEYVPRHHRLGLGAQPKPDDPNAGRKGLMRPGESRGPKPDLVYVDADGRTRHVKPIGEKLTVRGPTGFQAGATVRVAQGPHAGLDATIESVGGIDSDKKATVRLAINGQRMLLPLDYLTIPPSLPRKESPAVGLVSAAQPKPERADDREREPERKREREHTGEALRPDHAVADVKRARESVWIVAAIRVRVVDQRVHGGRLYNRKGVVVDTSRAGEFALLMDGEAAAGAEGTLREGLTQRMVETALPKPGGSVLVVRGEYRGRRGRLLERDSRKERAVVQLNGDFSVCTLEFDDVSEWAGAIEDAEDEF